jgi:hypothetical protein
MMVAWHGVPGKCLCCAPSRRDGMIDTPRLISIPVFIGIIPRTVISKTLCYPAKRILEKQI